MPRHPKFEVGETVREQVGVPGVVTAVEWSPPQECFFYKIKFTNGGHAENVREYTLETLPPTTDQDKIKQLETERDLWEARYHRVMNWVVWLREKVCHFHDRRNWQGLNRLVGLEDLFMASVEIQAEVNGKEVIAARLAESKDDQFRSLALQAAENATSSGKSGREA